MVRWPARRGHLYAGKILVGFLLAGLIVAALIDSRRLTYFRSTASWIAVVAGLVVLGPHLVWLYQHDFVTFEYALGKHITSWFAVRQSKSSTISQARRRTRRCPWSSWRRWRGPAAQ